MNERHLWINIIFGKVSLSVATVALALVSTLTGNNRISISIIGVCAIFIITHAIVTAAHDRSLVRRLGRKYELVQRRGIKIVSDLGQLAANNYELWMVDLYLSSSKWSPSKRWPLVVRNTTLLRQLTVSLIDARHQPTRIGSSPNPVWVSFSNSKPLIWYNKNIHRSDHDNAWDSFDDVTNAELAKRYGVLSVHPLVDHLDRNCIGILSIHVKPEPDVVLKAMGVLISDQGLLRLKDACVELNELLRR